MEIINYLASLLLILLAVLAKFNPSFIAGYNSLPENKKARFPMGTLFWGFFITATLTPVIAYNIRFLGYVTFADWTFLFTITIGVIWTIWKVNRSLKQD